MSKKKPETSPTTPATTEDVQVKTRVQPYLIVGIKGSTTGAKVAIEDVEAGKELLKDIHTAVYKKNVFLDEKRGLLFQGSEISHAFLTFEVVKA